MTEETQNPNLVNVQQGSKKFSRFALLFGLGYLVLVMVLIFLQFTLAPKDGWLHGIGVYLTWFVAGLPWSLSAFIFENSKVMSSLGPTLGPIINAGIIYLVIWKVQTFITAKKYAKTVQD